MKKLLALFLSLSLLLVLTACGNTEVPSPSVKPVDNSATDDKTEAEQPSASEENSESETSSGSEEISGAEDVESGEEEEWVDDRFPSPMIFEWTIETVMDGDGRTLTYTRMPYYLEDFEQIDLTDPYQAAAAAVMVLIMYEDYPVPALEVLDYLNGSDDVSAYDKSFLKEQFSQYPYVARSFWDGSSPENNYFPDDYTYSFTFFENDYSWTNDGRVTLWIFSGGADSEREVTLKQEPGDENWYLANYAGLVAGIRPPVDAD